MGTSWKLVALWGWAERVLPEQAQRPTVSVDELPSRLLRDAGGAPLTLGALGVAAVTDGGRLSSR